MKTFNDCCREVAEKYKLGSSLVTGHLPKYWEEAADMFAKEVALEFHNWMNYSNEAHLGQKRYMSPTMCDTSNRHNAKINDQLFDQFRKEKGV